MNECKALLAGFFAMLVFHQGGVALLHLAGMDPAQAWDMTPAGVLQLPAVEWLALRGAIWGVIIWWLIRSTQSAGFWVSAILLAVILRGAVVLFALPWLRHQPLAGGWETQFITHTLLLNAVWGFGLALFLRLLRVRQPVRDRL